MKTEPRLNSVDAAIDVVVLFAPRSTPRDQFERAVADWSALGRAVLVVLPCAVDTETLERLRLAGADLCVLAPTSEELFGYMERARRSRRRSSGATTGDAARNGYVVTN